jgi:hypothetical protein
MIVKLYVRYEEKLPGYWVLNFNPLYDKEILLDLLFMSLNSHPDWIFIDKTDDEVFITQHFFGDEEEDDVTLELTSKNYDYILDQWNKVVTQRPKYFILSWNDNDWIDLEFKNELSIEDQQYLDQEKIKNYQNKI